MKKIIYLVAASFVCSTMFAATTAKCKITLTSDQGGSDVLRIYEDDERTNEFENTFDATHFMNSGNENNVNIYSIQGNTEVSIVRSNNLTNLPIIIGTNAITTGYTLTFANVSGTISLYDLVEHQTINIIDGGSYSFTAAINSTIADRFLLNHPVPAAYQICYQYGAFEIANPDADARAINIYALGADGQPDTSNTLYTGSAEAAAVTTISAADLAAAGLVADTQYAIVVGAESALIFRVK